MELDVSRKYFMMSVRSNKTHPSDFGLLPHPEIKGEYLDKKDGSVWIQRDLYDFGWGNEYGFVKLPELDFEDLWELLLNSGIPDNQYGAAHQIEEKYADELLNLLLQKLEKPDFKADYKLKHAANLLKLHEARNRSKIIGKSSSQIQDDFEKWKHVAIALSQP